MVNDELLEKFVELLARSPRTNYGHRWDARGDGVYALHASPADSCSGGQMTRAEYDAIPAVNYSLLKSLAVSPLQCWHRHINPERQPQEPTPEMELGTALHCAVLQPSEFDSRYCCELDTSGIDGLLVTMDDLRGYCRDAATVPPASVNKRKDDLIAWMRMQWPSLPILDVLSARHAAQNVGKQMFKIEDWNRLAGMALALADEPALRALIKAGESEHCVQSVDPDTDIQLKGLLDWDAADWAVDLKTFSVRKGRTIDRSITEAIWFEKYYLQAVFYSMLKGWPEWRGDYVLAFVESDAPHETRLRAIRDTGPGVTLWQRGRHEIRTLLRTYKECMEHFGVDKPWRFACEVSAVDDLEIPGLAWE